MLTTYHNISEIPDDVCVAMLLSTGHCLKSSILLNIQSDPSHVRPVRDELARAKLPSAGQTINKYLTNNELTKNIETTRHIYTRSFNIPLQGNEVRSILDGSVRTLPFLWATASKWVLAIIHGVLRGFYILLLLPPRGSSLSPTQTLICCGLRMLIRT